MKTLCIFLIGIIALAGVTSASTNQPSVPSIIKSSETRAFTRRLGKSPKDALSVLRGGEGSGKSLELSTKAAVLTGVLLAFNSGYVNGVTLTGMLSSGGVKQASSAVTGAWTNSALGFVSGNKAQFNLHSRCILSYLGGSAIASLFNPNPQLFSISRASVSPVFLLGSALLYLSSSIAKSKGDNLFIYLAAIANGMQNSITSTATGNLVRSAHFSGITSDMGTFLGQVLRGNKANLMKLKVFAALGASFWIGGAASYFVTKEYASTSLLFSAGLYLLIGLGLGLGWF